MADNIRFGMRKATDVWSVRERLALASSVMRSGDQNWVSVSRAVRPFGAPNRPADWFSQKNCAMQYSDLLEKVETPRRKRGEREVVETPGDVIVRKLTIERIEELKKIIEEEKEKYRMLKADLALVQSGKMDGQMKELWEKLQSERQAAAEQESKRFAEEHTAREAAKAAAAALRLKRHPFQSTSLESPTSTVTKAMVTTELDESTQDSALYESLPLDSFTEEDTDVGVVASSISSSHIFSSLSTHTGFDPSAVSSNISDIKQEPSCSEMGDSYLMDSVGGASGVQSVKEERGAVDMKSDVDYKDTSLIDSSVKVEDSAEAPTTTEIITPRKESMESSGGSVVVEQAQQEVFHDDFVNVVEIVEHEVVAGESPGEEVVEASPAGNEELVPTTGEGTEEEEEEVTIRVLSKEEERSVDTEGVGSSDLIDVTGGGATDDRNVPDTPTSNMLKAELGSVDYAVSPSSSVMSTETVESSHGRHYKTSARELGSVDYAVSPASSETVESSRGRHYKTSGRGSSSKSRIGRRKSSSRLSLESKDADIGSKPSEAETSDDDLSHADDSSTTGQSHRRRRDPSESLPNSPASVYQSDTEEEKAHRTWKRSIMLVWRDIANHKYANTFLHPVTDDIAPGYRSVILRPMDLMTIKKNIDIGVIRNTTEFQRDMMLIFTNAILYNSVGHDVHKMARDMFRDTMTLIEQFVSTQMMVQTEPKSLRGVMRRSDISLSAAGGSDKEEEPKKRRNSEVDTPIMSITTAAVTAAFSSASSTGSSGTGEPRTKKRR